MAMRLRPQEENGLLQSVTSKHWVSHDQEFLSLVKIDVSDEIRADSCTTNFSVTSISPAYIDL